jgi:universal stress protein E
MTALTSGPRKVLAVMDTGDEQIALRSAAALADRHGAALEAFLCVEPPHDLGLIAKLTGKDTQRLIDTLVERARAETRARLREVLPDREIEPIIVVGKAFLEVIRHVAETDCDFVVKAAEPLHGPHRFLFASTDQHLLRKCPCPVWLQKPTAPITPRRVLAAIDLDVPDAEEPDTLTGLNRRVVDAAIGIASGSDAEVIVLHAWEAIGEGLVWAFSGGEDARVSADRYIGEVRDNRELAMHRFLTAIKETAPGPRITPKLARGAPEEVIQEQGKALRADVVVMGTVARTGLSGVFIGNTAENIINNLECPVLAVKPDGFVSPLL